MSSTKRVAYAVGRQSRPPNQFTLAEARHAKKVIDKWTRNLLKKCPHAWFVHQRGVSDDYEALECEICGARQIRGTKP